MPPEYIMMIYKIKWSMFFELSIRTILWFLFLLFDYAEPFIREIQESEIWKYQYPVTPSYIPAQLLWFIIFIAPVTVSLLEYTITGNKDDLKHLWLGITLSYGLTGLIVTYLKIFIGRPRPDFYFRCFPDGKGDDYNNCTGERRSYLDGRKSFPSGHASFAFACMAFLSLYLAKKFHLFKENRGQSWHLVICTLPLMFSAGIAISRTCDYHHHYEDVAAGSLLGSVISYLCYRLYFPTVVPSASSE